MCIRDSVCAISSTVERNYLADPGLHRTLLGDGLATSIAAVSYTHLDVYKRQGQYKAHVALLLSSRHSSTAQEADTSDAINVGSTTQ